MAPTVVYHIPDRISVGYTMVGFSSALVQRVPLDRKPEQKFGNLKDNNEIKEQIFELIIIIISAGTLY